MKDVVIGSATIAVFLYILHVLHSLLTHFLVILVFHLFAMELLLNLSKHM